MKSIILYISLFLGTFISIQGQQKNESIVTYAKTNLNQKIDRGECWDLIAFALNDAKANWNAPFEFGKVIKSDYLPGDIIRFENVKFESENGYMTFPEHYAILYEVKDKNKIVIAHQNHNNKRVVQLLDLNLSEKVKGKITFYRAQ